MLSFHPHVDSLLASAGYDGQLLLWDLSSLQVVLSLEKLQEPVCLNILVEVIIIVNVG